MNLLKFSLAIFIIFSLNYSEINAGMNFEREINYF